jgi:preprotein translocase subunit YajC
MENVANVAGGDSAFSMLLWIVVVFGIMYFLMIRPNKKRMEEYKKMLSELKVGNKIVFAGGIYGVVRAINDDTVKVEIADGVIIEIPKSSVANIA